MYIIKSNAKRTVVPAVKVALDADYMNRIYYNDLQKNISNETSTIIVSHTDLKF